MSTGNFTPQYHVVYDDWFSTIPNFNHPETDPNEGINVEALITLEFSREYYIDEEVDENGFPLPPPDLELEWMTPGERETVFLRKDQDFVAPWHQTIPVVIVPRPILPPPPPPLPPVQNSQPQPVVHPFVPFIAPPLAPAPPVPILETYPDPPVDRGDGDRNDGPADSGLRRSTRVPGGGRTRRPMGNEFVGISATSESRQRYLSKKVRLGQGLGLLATKQACCISGDYVAGLTWADVDTKGSRTSQNLYDTMHKYGEFDSSFLSTLNRGKDNYPKGETSAAQFFRSAGAHLTYGGLVEEFHPLALLMKANVEDNPTWNAAINGIHSQSYWKAMEVEIATLKEKNAFVEVQREKHMKVVQTTWAFKCKRFPDGRINKFKARFCVRGDTQEEGIDYFETFAPVVSWTSLRIMFILSITLRLECIQVYYTAAFVQALLSESDGDIYVTMPRGFATPGAVYKLKRSLYGMRQSPRNFFLHLKKNLELAGFVQSNSEPCMFSCGEVVCLCYVDDCLFYAPTKKHIDTIFNEMKKIDLDFHIGNEMAGFLGVDIIHHEDGSIELLQTGLIDRIIYALGLKGATSKRTPAEYGSLGSDKDGADRNEAFSYPSVIGMLMYLTGNSRPELSFAVHQCARYTHDPKASHENAVKRIGRYLVGTRLNSLILRPDPKLGVEMFVDADFAGMWGFGDPTLSSSCRSRTGFVICLGGCPVLWKSTMQTEVASSTMQAEYIALSTAMRDLLPF